MSGRFSLLFALSLIGLVSCVDPPPGLRPAKAVDTEEPATGERKVLPLAEKSKDEPVPPPNVRTPPNLSLRSRMIAAQNSAAAASHDEPHQEQDSTASTSSTSTASVQQPVVFSRAPKNKPTKQKSGGAVKKTVIVPVESQQKLPRVAGPTPPKGNYGVNTLLQTNLVDSQGRIIKGVSSVPIPLPASGELRNKGQATAAQIGNDEDRVVPVKFGRAGDQ